MTDPPGRQSNGGTGRSSGVISDGRKAAARTVLYRLLCGIPGERSRTYGSMQTAETAGFDRLGLSARGLPGRAGCIMLASGVIYSYSRADAIRDGVLIELPDAIVREAGIVFPVAVTDKLWGYIYRAGLPGQTHGAVSKRQAVGPALDVSSGSQAGRRAF